MNLVITVPDDFDKDVLDVVRDVAEQLRTEGPQAVAQHSVLVVD